MRPYSPPVIEICSALQLLAKQLTVEIQQLRSIKKDSSEYDALRRERNGYKDE